LSFSSSTACACEVHAANLCCAAEFQKKDCFQQSSVIRLLICPLF
jgi:hypothetical protein